MPRILHILTRVEDPLAKEIISLQTQKSDVTIDLIGGCLRITAHLRTAAPKDYLLHEWDYGGYERELDLPPGFGGGVDASLANGQLAVRVLRGETSGRISISPRSS